MQSFQSQSLSLDAIHGYIPFTSPVGIPEGEVAERDIIDHPWIQRLRQIHQLQTAWWVFPTAEHTRFQHVLGAMHLASRAAERLYPSLREVCPDAPSRGYVETLLRLAALLHDVGHGPFGHFFDRHYLADYGLTHETLGAEIIRRELADLLVRIRRNPNTALEEHETLDPHEIGLLFTRPTEDDSDRLPRWLQLLRSLFSGLYTVDNMDFVLRDAYMSGYSVRAFDLERLLHYSAFTSHGLTVHERGLSALVRFIGVRGELFRAVYFHRTVRAIDLSLQELFAESKPFLFPGNPLSALDQYQQFTEWSLLARVAGWHRSSEPALAALGRRWQDFLGRRVRRPFSSGRGGRGGKGQRVRRRAALRSHRAEPVAGEASQAASEIRPLAARLPPRHGRPGRGAELPLRSGHRPHSQPRRAGVVPPDSGQLPHLPHLRRKQRAQRGAGRGHRSASRRQRRG